MNCDLNVFGTRLKEARSALGMSAYALGQLTGIDRNAIQRIEYFRVKQVSYADAKVIADCLGTTIDYLFGDTDVM